MASPLNNTTLFNPRLLTHELSHSRFGAGKSGVEKFMVEKSRVEKFGVGKFMVEKSRDEQTGVEAWVRKVRG